MDASSPIGVVSTAGSTEWVVVADRSAVGETGASEAVASGTLGSVPTADVVGGDTAGGLSLAAGGIVTGVVDGRPTGRETIAGFVIGAGLGEAASMTDIAGTAAAAVTGRRFVAVAVEGLGDEVGLATGGAAGVAGEAGGALGVDDAFTIVGTAEALSPAAASRRAPHASTTKTAKSTAPATVVGRTRFA